MSTLGKQVRLNRIFSHPSRRVLTVAVDHLINYPDGLPKGLDTITVTTPKVLEGRPSAITLNKGAAMRCMGRHAGRVPLIIQSIALKPDEAVFADHASVEECLALGADAIAVAIFVKGPAELGFLRHLGQVVRDGERHGLPVIPHIYPLSSGDERHTVTHNPDDIRYAVRLGLELGADVIKVPYTGDVASYRDIVNDTPVPLVAAGGPKAETLDDAVRMMREIAHSGAAGATVGRNVWSFPDIPAAIAKLKEAMQEAPPSQRPVTA